VSTIQTETARRGAALLSGGGVLTLADTTERRGAFAATGGGVASVSGHGETEEHRVTLAASGGGTMVVGWTTTRIAGFTGTGGGLLIIEEPPGISGPIIGFVRVGRFTGTIRY
jgi:hypothetical protein